MVSARPYGRGALKYRSACAGYVWQGLRTPPDTLHTASGGALPLGASGLLLHKARQQGGSHRDDLVVELVVRIVQGTSS